MLNSLLPISATDEEREIEASTARISDVPILVRESWNPDACPSALLPWLAWAFRVDAWDATWTDDQKRAAINSSLAVHRRKGTPGALQDALAVFGLDAINIREWQTMTPLGAPYTFDVQLVVNQTGIPNPATYDQIVTVATATKNVRSKMLGVEILGLPSGQMFCGGVAYCGETVTLNAG